MRAWLSAALAALLVLATEQIVEHYAHRSELEQERSDVLNQLSTLRARLEGVVNINLSLVHGLTAVVESRPDIDQAGFAALARGLFDERYALRNIGAAPDMVLSLMYPLAGNEAALGLDYRRHPEQREAALRARDSGRTVIAGPVSLVQGGQAIIARQPVFLPPAREGGERRFWGLVSAAIDLGALYGQAGLLDADLGLRIALRGSDGSGASGPLFFGDEALFRSDPVSVEVTLPGGGSWLLAALPVDGWGRIDTGVVLLRLVSVFAGLGAALMAFRLVRSADALADHSARLDRTGRLAKVGGWQFDVLSRRGSWSDETARIHDLEPGGEIDASYGLSFFHGESRRLIEQAVAAAIEEGQPYDLELELISARGISKSIRTIGLPVIEAGKVVRLEGAVQDISERKRAEALARQGDLLLGSVFQALPDLFFLMDADGTIRDYRAQPESELYVPPEVFLGRRMPDVLPPEVGELLRCRIAKAGEQRGLNTCEYEMVVGGRLRHYEARLTALPDSTQVIAVVRDISERVAAEALLAKQWRILADSQRMAQVGSWELDLASGAISWSDETYRIFGVSPDSFAPDLDSFMAMLHPDDRRTVEDAHAALIAGEGLRDVVYRIVRPDGSVRFLNGGGIQLHDADGRLTGTAGTVQDVTERMLAERSLRDSEERLRLALQAARQGIYDLDLRSGEATVSPEYARMLGYEPDGFVETHASWRARLHPDDRVRVSGVFDDYLAGRIPEYRVEFRLRTKSGGWRWILSLGEVRERDSSGKPLRMLGTHTDMTERKRMEDEIRQLNADLEARVRRRTAELDAANKELQTFTYSVSHDLKAPLRGIDGYSRLLFEDHRAQLDEEGRLFVDNVRRGVARMGRLIDDLLAYSRLERRPLHGQELDLARQVSVVLDARQTELREHGVRVELDLAGLKACADPDGLDIVLRNLVDNALKFSAGRQPPTLAISGTQKENTVTLAIRDNGIGFDMRFHDRIFEIFQRLQRVEDFPGTGVGLAMVHKAVQRMGGRIWAESAPGQGATFYLELPR